MGGCDLAACVSHGVVRWRVLSRVLVLCGTEAVGNQTLDELFELNILVGALMYWRLERCKDL